MTKRTTAVSLKRSCAQQRALRNFLKYAFTCQIPQLYIDQVPCRSTHKPLSYRRDGQTDGQTDRRTDVISALYSRYQQTVFGKKSLESECSTLLFLINASKLLIQLQITFIDKQYSIIPYLFIFHAYIKF